MIIPPKNKQTNRLGGFPWDNPSFRPRPSDYIIRVVSYKCRYVGPTNCVCRDVSMLWLERQVLKVTVRI